MRSSDAFSGFAARLCTDSSRKDPSLLFIARVLQAKYRTEEEWNLRVDRFGVCLFKMSYFIFSTVWGYLLFRNESFMPPQMLGPANGSIRVSACVALWRVVWCVRAVPALVLLAPRPWVHACILGSVCGHRRSADMAFLPFFLF